jgi:hypothetical protein
VQSRARGALPAAEQWRQSLARGLCARYGVRERGKYIGLMHDGTHRRWMRRADTRGLLSPNRHVLLMPEAGGENRERSVRAYPVGLMCAGLKIRSEDVYVRAGRRTWVRLHEKGGKRHEMPCHHTLETPPEQGRAVHGCLGGDRFQAD